MLLIFLIIVLSLLTSYLVIGYRIFKAIRRKDKRKAYQLSLLLTLLILIPGFYLRILPGSNFFWKPIELAKEKNYNVELTGFEFNDGDLIYVYESERFFNGDGYSIWIYKIDEQTAEYFKNPNEEFFSKHPQTELRSHWIPEFWKKTPFDKKEQKFLDFAHSTLDELDFELEDLLNEKGNYYAYEYFIHDFTKSEVVANIDFYIICPNRKFIVKINHNT
ncbi:hypothetical protein [Psychroserpens sp. S379A]|uniref:hypothetical protein n=1 Tax=Psychroserpens sp. S379A TaxID=3415137 RepID=UPI003C7BC18F